MANFDFNNYRKEELKKGMFASPKSEGYAKSEVGDYYRKW